MEGTFRVVSAEQLLVGFHYFNKAICLGIQQLTVLSVCFSLLTRVSIRSIAVQTYFEHLTTQLGNITTQLYKCRLDTLNRLGCKIAFP